MVWHMLETGLKFEQSETVESIRLPPCVADESTVKTPNFGPN
jgi:hypothetical protein